MYEILIAWRSTSKTPVISLTEFRQQLGVLPEEYPRMFDFKKYVLDSALKQINAHTDIQVTYEQHKTGRRITGLSFTLKTKKVVSKKLSKNLWEAVPVGTRYQNSDGDVWVKEESGFLYCKEKKQSMPPHLAKITSQNGTLKIIN